LKIGWRSGVYATADVVADEVGVVGVVGVVGLVGVGAAGAVLALDVLVGVAGPSGTPLEHAVIAPNANTATARLLNVTIMRIPTC
jgi:hypothetical protein